jgi:dienelactone hydrolase
VVVEDVLVPVPGQSPLAAYLVRADESATDQSRAGILFLHWLGHVHSDRAQFLAEAVELARGGAVSLLPQGRFPWTARPVGDATDVESVITQREAFDAALRYLQRTPQVDARRVAVVGHDYGAMYGALLVDQHPELAAFVLAAPDAVWGTWFATYWLDCTGPRARAYNSLFHGLQPTKHVGRLGSRLLLQWAGADTYVPSAVRERYAAVVPQAAVELYPTADHQLGTRAKVDRDTFLAVRLDLSV